MSRYSDAVSRIDAANAEDPNRINVEGRDEPAELAYGRRMSEELERLDPAASELLRVAARAQHIRRWTVHRSSFPMDRAGYHRWRNELKDMHARLAADIAAASGYSAEEAQRIAALVRKTDLKRDAEAQTLEDVACLVFLRHYAGEFAAKHDDGKLTGILRKTWVKMSERGHAAAATIALPERLQKLLAAALA